VKIFVASTYPDLLDYRAAATKSIIMAGHLTEDMSYWAAAEEPPLDVSLRHLRSSDLMILLIAHRYGTPPAGYDRSITELEFDEAVKMALPILAFRVDPDQSWPPRYIDIEPEYRQRLANFTERVKQKVTTSLFTTPASLEVAITHALVAFAGKRAQVSLPGYVAARLQNVSRAESLCVSSDAVIRVGSAPDGSPLLLSVRRQIPVAEPMGRIAEALGKDPDGPVFSGIISQLSQEAQDYATASGVHRTAWQGESLDVYVPYTKMAQLMSPTLFQAMLGGMSGRDEGRSGWLSESTATTMVGLDASDVRTDWITSLGGENRFLCVGLEPAQRVWSGGWSAAEPPSLILSRPFIEEGLERLSGVQYVIKRKNDAPTYYTGARYEPFTTILETEQPEQFIAGWLDILSSAAYEDLLKLSHEIRVPRSSVISFILEVAEEVAGLHEQGIIHGDIKPSNTLVNRAGRTLIDEVGLMVGDTSPTITAGWSPCEQLLRMPLSCAADIFPLGQLLRHFMDGQTLGREVTYRMPDGGTATIIEDPTIYISENSCIRSAETRKKWCHFIEKALRTDHRHRWPSAGAMAEELRPLVEQKDVEGYVSLKLPWGDQPSLAHTGNGELTVAWVMQHHQITRLW
jgi:hypothetical protein